jgi:outer membrane protein insertion porin family
VSLTRALGPRFPVTLSYELSYGRTEANDVRFCTLFNVCLEDDIEKLSSARATAVLALRTEYDRTDNVLDPRRGARYAFETLFSDEVIGSDPLSQFVSFLGGASFYHEVGRRSVFAWRLQAGIIFATKVPLGGSSGAFVPLEHRFYAGGPNTVRGFTRNELGPLVFVADTIPVDSTDLTDPTSCIPYEGRCAFERQRASPTGGNTIVLGSAEYRVPFLIYPRRLRFAMFVDVGQVWDRGTSSATDAPLRVTPGIGFRVATPLGPARFDIAWNPYDLQSGPLYVLERTRDPTSGQVISERLVRVAREPDLGRGGGFFSDLQFHFSIGQAF